MMGQTTQILLLLLFQCSWFTAIAGFNPKAIDAEKINPNISEIGHFLLLSWRNPETSVIPRCYETHLLHKSSCHENWTENYVKDTSNFTFPVRKSRGSYGFKVRMRYECRRQPWSGWTHEIWTNTMNQGSCNGPMPQGAEYYHILWALITLITVLLFCLLTQKWVRNNLFQIIPDPKHVQQNIMNLNHTEWWDKNTGECVTIEVEELDPDKTNQEEQNEEEVEGSGQDEDNEAAEETMKMVTEEKDGDLQTQEGDFPGPAQCHHGDGGGYIHWGQTAEVWPSQT